MTSFWLEGSRRAGAGRVLADGKLLGRKGMRIVEFW
jgi:hypothetical protein